MYLSLWHQLFLSVLNQCSHLIHALAHPYRAAEAWSQTVIPRPCTQASWPSGSAGAVSPISLWLVERWPPKGTAKWIVANFPVPRSTRENPNFVSIWGERA